MERDAILQLLRERIIRFVASQYGRDVAEDVAQEVLVVLHVKYPGVAAIEELVPLSLQIARWKLAGARRKLVRRGEHNALPIDDLQAADPKEDPESAAARRENLTRLTRAIRQLGDRCRHLMRLKLQGLGFAEIQQRMGAASLNTVYTWDFRCRQQLLEKLEGAGKEVDG